MSLGVACLLANDRVTSLSIADRLDALNKERRFIESQMQKEAFTIIDQLNLTRSLPADWLITKQIA